MTDTTRGETVRPSASREAVRKLPRPNRSNGFAERVRTVGILGTGTRVPDRVLDNHELERMVDTSDEWIVARTGMRERRLAAPDEATSDLAVAAARAALAQSGVPAEDIDLIVLATATPDHYCCPPTSCLIQERLGAKRAAAFDLSAACSGFINALTTARGLIAAGTFDTALVIGAEVLSSVTDYEDRDTCVLFGDGAGAVVLGAEAERGTLLDQILGADGSGADLIEVTAGGSRKPASAATVANGEHFMRIHGRKVFKFAVGKMCEMIMEITERNGCTPADLDLLVPHQANLRIIEAAFDKLGIPMSKVCVNVDRMGNTSSASVPMALDEAHRGGRLKPGDLVCLLAFGGGLTWGATLLRW